MKTQTTQSTKDLVIEEVQVLRGYGHEVFEDEPIKHICLFADTFFQFIMNHDNCPPDLVQKADYNHAIFRLLVEKANINIE